MNRRTAALTLVAAIGISGCARIGAAPPHELHIADPSDPSSLNPLLAHDQDTIGFDLLFVQTLVGLSADNRVIPVLVTRVPSRDNGDVSQDGRTIVYRLRHDARFADGRPLTSSDVRFTFRAIMDPRNPVLGQDAYRRIESLTAPDSHTVVIRLRAPWNAAVREIFAQSDFAFGILPSHAFASTSLQGAAWEAHAFGSGPFRVTQWVRGDRVVLVPNPYFFPHPKLARIELKMVPDFESALIGVRSREIDIARMQPSQAVELSGTRARLQTTPINGMDYLALQTAASPTNELPVRRAIAMALEIPVIERAFYGLYPPAASFLPPVFPWHDRSLKPIPHSAAAAAAELERAGWRLRNGVREKDGVPLDILFVRQAPGYAGGPSAITQRQLAEIGVRLTIKAFPRARSTRSTGRFAAGDSTWPRRAGSAGRTPSKASCSPARKSGRRQQRAAFLRPAIRDRVPRSGRRPRRRAART